MCRERPVKFKKIALPTLNLPEYNEASTEESCLSFLPEEQKYVTPQKVKDLLKRFQQIESLPSTSLRTPELKLQVPEQVYQPPSKKIKLFEDYSGVPSTSGTSYSVVSSQIEAVGSYGFAQTQEHVETDIDCLSETLGVTVLPKTPSPTEEKIPKHVKKRISLLQLGGVTRQQELTPKAKAFYSRARNLQRMASRRKFQQLSTRAQLRLVQSQQQSLQFLNSVNDTTLNFFLSQQRTQKFKPKGFNSTPLMPKE